MDEIRDIKPPIETPLWVWILIALAVCAVIVAIYIFWKRRKPTVVVPPTPAWEVALERLERLASKEYMKRGASKEFYSELSGIIRHYLEDRFHINAPEMTTDEFLHHVKTTADLSDSQKQTLRDFLNNSDMVKFAKHEPTVSEGQASYDLAKQLIMETKTPDGI